ncbi:MAG: hypothetical protein ACSLE5_15475, partial [Porticoccaceae bacterium]
KSSVTTHDATRFFVSFSVAITTSLAALVAAREGIIYYLRISSKPTLKAEGRKEVGLSGHIRLHGAYRRTSAYRMEQRRTPRETLNKSFDRLRTNGTY